jgi:hypothetical protein
LRTSSVIASASPRASAAVVLAVGDGNHSGPDAPDGFEQPDELFGLPAVRQRQHHVVLADGAEIAVNRLRGMEEERRRAGARERRGNLPADDAGLAHPGHDHASPALEEDLERALEVVADPIDQTDDGGRLDLENLAREFQRGRRRLAHRATADRVLIA